MKANQKKILLGGLLFILIILTIPIIAFIVQFYSYSFSNNIEQWAEFGDYISGTINTLISLASLILLSVLTYYVAENSNKESRKLEFYNKRLEIYDCTCQWLIESEEHINSFSDIG